MPIADYQRFDFSHGEASRPVFRRGEGPGVLLMHELPGLADETVLLGDRIAEAGYTVFMPLLYGEVGVGTVKNMGDLRRACIRREFALFAKRKSSPITVWLRALGRQIYDELGGKGVGAIGMCLTGNFALALMVDEHIMAPILSQPSLPFGVTPSHRRALHVSDEELVTIKKRVAEGQRVLGMRFTGDLLSPGRKFARLREELGEGFEGIEIDSSRKNQHGISPVAHSVLTYDLVDQAGHPTHEALERVISFLGEELR